MNHYHQSPAALFAANRAVVAAALLTTLFRTTGQEDGWFEFLEYEHQVRQIGVEIYGAMKFEELVESVEESLRTTAAKKVLRGTRLSKQFTVLLTPVANAVREELVWKTSHSLQLNGSPNLNGLQNGLVNEEGSGNDNDNPNFILSVISDGVILRGEIECALNHYTRDTIENFGQNLKKSLFAALRFPSSTLASLQLFTPCDVEEINSRGAPDGLLSSKLSLVDHFRAAVAKYGPENAVLDGKYTLTYSELDEKSDRLASWLLLQGLMSEDIVGLVRILSFHGLYLIL